MRLDPLTPDKIATIATNMLTVVKPFYRDAVDPSDVYEKAKIIVAEELEKRIEASMRGMIEDLHTPDLFALLSHLMGIETQVEAAKQIVHKKRVARKKRANGGH